jgi:hypothetical protein
MIAILDFRSLMQGSRALAASPCFPAPACWSDLLSLNPAAGGRR